MESTPGAPARASTRRLCSETEWEKACKGPDNPRYPYGNGYDANACTTEDGSGRDRSLAEQRQVLALPVGLRGDGHLRQRGGVDRELYGSGSDKALKGGAFNRPDYAARCSARKNAAPSSRSSEVGFRCCAGSGSVSRLAAMLLLLASCRVRRCEGGGAARGGLSAYSQVVAGFGAELKADLEEATLDDDGAHQAAVLRKVVSEQPALVLAVGPLAATLARRSLTDVPVLFCMVPYYERYGLEGPKTTGIALTSDSRSSSPRCRACSAANRVGILHDPRYSSAVIAQAQKIAQKAGVRIVPLAAESADEVERALSQARGKVNALC